MAGKLSTHISQAAPEQYSALFPFRQARFNDSISTNPYFFFPQFAGVLVSPAGYAFPPAMMANHSAEYPSGYLDKATFKTFFAISGDSGSFTYQPGYERIPGKIPAHLQPSQVYTLPVAGMERLTQILESDNWYRRPSNDGYTIPE